MVKAEEKTSETNVTHSGRRVDENLGRRHNDASFKPCTDAAESRLITSAVLLQFVMK